MRAMHQQAAYIPVSPFADAQQVRLPARGVLARHQAQPGRKLPAVAKGADIPRRRQQRRRRHRTIPGIVIKRHACSSARAIRSMRASRCTSSSYDA